MHHFRGRLRDGDKTRLDPANVYVEYRDDGWDGYILVSSQRDVEPGKAYSLTLVDGRSGMLRVDNLTPEDSGMFRASFVGDGPLG
jgi:hypothetical protein